MHRQLGEKLTLGMEKEVLEPEFHSPEPSRGDRKAGSRTGLPLAVLLGNVHADSAHFTVSSFCNPPPPTAPTPATWFQVYPSQ